VPSANTLSQAFKLSIQVGLPIESYFYIDSCRGKYIFALMKQTKLSIKITTNIHHLLVTFIKLKKTI